MLDGGSNGTRIILLKKISELSIKYEKVDDAIEHLKEAKYVIDNSNESMAELPSHFKERIMYLLAVCYHKNGDLVNSRDILESIIEELEKTKAKVPLVSDVYYEICVILQKSDPKKALGYVEKGISNSASIYGSGNYSTRRFINLREALQR